MDKHLVTNEKSLEILLSQILIRSVVFKTHKWARAECFEATTVLTFPQIPYAMLSRGYSHELTRAAGSPQLQVLLQVDDWEINENYMWAFRQPRRRWGIIQQRHNDASRKTVY